LIAGNVSRINKARMLKRKNELQNTLQIAIEQDMKTSSQLVVELWQNFHELCLSLSRLDGKMNFKEIQHLNIYDFYNLKKWLFKLHKPKTADMGSGD
jgi:hypothetical protein